MIVKGLRQAGFGSRSIRPKLPQHLLSISRFKSSSVPEGFAQAENFSERQRLGQGRASPFNLDRPVAQSQYSQESPYVFRTSFEVRNAVRERQPVVALESTIYTHGFPYPENVSLALDLERIVRENGAIPATIGILDGVARVGLSSEEITRLAACAGTEETMKVSRRDLPFILGMRLAGRKLNGGTTVSGTMILAARAGIQIFGTGGLGGVHRDGENSMDISADLTELGRTPVAVISSGCKSFLDIPRTLEYLETQGVGISTFADGRAGAIDFPAFYTRDSGSRSPNVVQDAREAAAIIYARLSLFPTHRSDESGLAGSGLLFANPIPEAFAMRKAEIDLAINQAVKEAAEQGFHGNANTPFVLSRIKELTKGNSLPANRALIESNVAMAAKVAVEYSKLRQRLGEAKAMIQHTQHGVVSRFDEDSTKPSIDFGVHVAEETPTQRLQSPTALDYRNRSRLKDPENLFRILDAKILVFGSVAVDLSCDYRPLAEVAASTGATSNDDVVSPLMKTSNIAAITPSIGGVGHNVALAAHLAAGKMGVQLHSLVSDDVAGKSIIRALEDEGLNAAHVRTIAGKRTAQYVAVNDAKKDLVIAMADMSLFNETKALQVTYHIGTSSKEAAWAVIDANWKPRTIRAIIKELRENKPILKIAYEPVSAPKSGAIFHRAPVYMDHPIGIFPGQSIDLATPNKYELAQMHATARKNEFFEAERWWTIIDSLGIPSSGARDRFVRLTSAAMTDEGIPLQTIQLLPYMPTILTKMGADGVLLTELLKPEDPRLTAPEYAAYILSRTSNGSTEVGGVYMRLFPAVEVVDDIVSVNGVGDTFLGVLIAGLAKGLTLDERLIEIAQRGAVMTLRSKEAVSPDVKELAAELDQLCQRPS